MKQGVLIRLGNLKLDPNGRRFYIGRKPISLRNMEYSLIEYMMNHPGRVLSRTQILEDVWDRNMFCSTNTIDVHVSSLRRKLSRYTTRDVIHTVHCIGYLFDC